MTDEEQLKKNRETLSTYTNYPAVLEYFLMEDNAGGGWKNPKVMALVEDITKDCKIDYENKGNGTRCLTYEFYR